MPRLRFTREEAESEAKRLATEFLTGLSGAQSAQCSGAHPDPRVPNRPSSKHPVAWLVYFIPSASDPNAVVDGEACVSVNLETRAVAMSEVP